MSVPTWAVTLGTRIEDEFGVWADNGAYECDHNGERPDVDAEKSKVAHEIAEIIAASPELRELVKSAQQYIDMCGGHHCPDRLRSALRPFTE